MLPPRPTHLSQYSISVEKTNRRTSAKATFTRRVGTFSEIRTPEYEFAFNLNGEIKYIRGRTPDWPHPAEQFKRTDGNDWVYYSVGDDSSDKGLISWLGEYYLPCLPYPSNSAWEVNYFANAVTMRAFSAWSQLYADLYGVNKEGAHPKVRSLVEAILEHHDGVLHDRAKKLQSIIGGRVTVLPPDTRHVDYEVIPLTIADGCLYHCDFCCVKSDRSFRVRPMDDILRQIRELSSFYGRNITNYHALYLGNHDALHAGGEILERAASAAYEAFGFHDTDNQCPALFLFGSVGSFLKTKESVFEGLDRLPFKTYINLGFESVDPDTLAEIGKPIDSGAARSAFQRMLRVNSMFNSIEVTGNFLLGDALSSAHYDSLTRLLSDIPPTVTGKGAVYLSPLKDSPKKRELLPRFLDIKQQSRLPTFIYVIQRL